MTSDPNPSPMNCAATRPSTPRVVIVMVARVAVLVTLVLLLASYSVSVYGQSPSAERVLFDALNNERASQKLGQLRWDNALAAAARQHAILMAQSNTLSHQLPGEPPLLQRARQARAHFSLIAENIAEAPTTSYIHNAWMQSRPHRGNILDPQLNAVGIAVVQRGGELFAVQDFSRAADNLSDNLSLDQQEQQVVSLLAARGLQVANFPEARQSCYTDRAFNGNHPASVVRFETADLRSLPDDLEQRLRRTPYRVAAVGACSSEVSSSGVTRFRIAVLLY
ncbi:MAG: hypothetical protein NVS9B4_14350 [Candidatus Acidiferrum sp.]